MPDADPRVASSGDPERSARHIVVRSVDGITWVRRSATPVAIQPPELDGRANRALQSASVPRTPGTPPRWLGVAAAEADYLLVFGPHADEAAADLAALGFAHLVVTCASRRDAELVARILALPGDTVIQEADGLALFPAMEAESGPVD